ncbi:hypothetical protein S40288_03332 [Stachybotrys chartarum IBT 40288]|nr:hypothetical protein S40288_03332 [Stachybotrys chartarum IBT 40288]
MASQPHFSARGSAAHMRSLGITQSITPLPTSWTGELRVRFSDFQVNEISTDGSVVHLRSIGMSEQQNQEQRSKKEKPVVVQDESKEANALESDQPSERAPQTPSEDAPAKLAASEGAAAEISDEDLTPLQVLAGGTFAQDLLQLFKDSVNPGHDKKAIVLSEPMTDKPKRGQIHQEVRRIFSSKIDTRTSDSGAILASVASTGGRQRGKRGGGGGGGRDRQEEKPSGEYLHFTLYKDNRDTMDAVNQIARMLRLKPQSITYAGTKDRRASTAQRCSIRHMRPRNLAGINGKLRGMVTGDYAHKEEPIHLGELLGNEFTITIKNCHVTDEAAGLSTLERVDKIKALVQPALDHMAEHGWINYFGHQRFGTHHIGTHDIGKLILADKFQEAVAAILSYNPDIAEKAENGEMPEDASGREEHARHQACMLFTTGKDIEKAASIMPRRFAAETAVLRHLTRQGQNSAKDFVGAIIHITRGLRSMYLHAYQSLTWNYAVSKRWELYGAKVVKGDLVIAEGDAAQGIKQDQDGDDVINPGEEYDEDAPVRARALSEEEAASGRYTIYDVVLPTPGHDVIYPDNDIGRFYEEFMGREENGSLDPHKMRRMHREFSLPGRYRKLINRFLAKPSVEVMAYADDIEQMHPTDLDIIRSTKKESRKRRNDDSNDDEHAGKRTKTDGQDGTETPGPSHDGVGDASLTEDPVAEPSSGAAETRQRDKVAAVVKFQLGRSAYATVALRELMGDPPEESH